MLAILEKKQFRVLADGHHFDEATQKAILGLNEKMAPTTSHFMTEAPPGLVKHLAEGKPLAPHTYADGWPLDQSDVADLSKRVDVALRHGKPVHGVDVATTFEQLARPKVGGSAATLAGNDLAYRLQSDKRVGAEVKRIAGEAPVTLTYGEAHLGRPDSIDAFLPRDKTAIVGVYPNQKSFEEAARSNEIFEGTGTAQRSPVEWLDFIKLADTGEVFANTALKTLRANPTQHRIIPMVPK